MLLLSGADVVGPDGVAASSTVVVDRGIIVDVRAGRFLGGEDDRSLDLHGCLVLPGFVDVHVHGVDGHDSLDEGPAIAAIAARLPRFGVTSFCPTTVACAPGALRRVLDQVREMRDRPPAGGARVLPAHLESNFISADYRGAQPLEMLREPGARPAGAFAADDILAEISRARAEVGIVTVAPEIPRGLDLVGALVARGYRVSLGHSGATVETGRAALEAGATQGTHLFNRMPPLGHRAPGLAGALLTDPRPAVEVVCDGRHVHPAMLRLTIAARSVDRVMAITDGLAPSGLPDGTTGTLGGRAITVRGAACYLDDGTLAGSALTFDGGFRVLVQQVGLSLVEAARMCATTPARELGLRDRGAVAPGLLADLVVLDRDLRVVHTCVGGELVRSRS